MNKFIKSFSEIKLFISLIILLFTFISCVFNKNKQKNTNQLDSNLETEDVFKGKENDENETIKNIAFLDEYKKDFWEANNLWGGFLVARNGKIIYEHYSGCFDEKNQIKNDFNRSLHIASVSKVFTATLILKLIDTGFLALNQPVYSLLPDFPYPDITVKMLLNHRSGLIKYEDFTTKKTIWNQTQILYNKDILALLAKYKPNLYFKPNTKFTYTNTNYALLALVIEKVTKKSYPEAMQIYLFDPLEMKSTFVYTVEDDAKKSRSYYYGGAKEYKNNYLDMIYGDKNIYSTPRDLLKFDKALYSNIFLSKTMKDLAYTGYSYEANGIKNYGLGMRIMEWEDGKKILYHNGWWHGNNSVFVHMEKDSIAIIALGNKYSNKVYSAFDLIGYFGGYPRQLKNKSK